MQDSLFCMECGAEVVIGEQTSYGECIDYRYNHGGIVCETCYERLRGFSDVMVLQRKKENTAKCPHCNSKKFVKAGLDRGKQRYLCKTCHRTFIP